MSNRAWVTLATNDSYGLGALVLAHSLRRTGSSYPAVVLITPSVTDAMKDRLSAVFAEVITVDVLDSRDAAHLALLQRPELGITFTKLHCWNLTQYEKCVFLDADALVVQNCDELFEREELSAAPDVGWPDCFNTGVFVFSPSKDTFEKLIKFAQERGSFDGGDQGLLNSFFSDWAHGDINKHLPFLYNVTSAAFYSYIPALKHYGQNLKIIHFIGASKPWLQQFNWDSQSVEAPDHLRDFLQLWWNLFVQDVHSRLDESMTGVAGNLARVVFGSTGYSRDAVDELTRRQGWEAGNIDYMGADSFANIWAKISQTLNQPRPSPPKQSPPKEIAAPPKKQSPPKDVEVIPPPKEPSPPTSVQNDEPVEIVQTEVPLEAQAQVVSEDVIVSETVPSIEKKEAPTLDVSPPIALETADSEQPTSDVTPPTASESVDSAKPQEASVTVPEVQSEVVEAKVLKEVAKASEAQPPKLEADIATPVLSESKVTEEKQSEKAQVEDIAKSVDEPIVAAQKEAESKEIDQPIKVKAVDDSEVIKTEEDSTTPSPTPFVAICPAKLESPPEKSSKALAVCPAKLESTPEKSSEASAVCPAKLESTAEKPTEALAVCPAKLESTPEKPSEASAVSTDSPPLVNTPSKEETPPVPAAKSEERRKPVGKLQLSPPVAADPLPTPDSELEDAASLAQKIIASELRTPTVSSPSPLDLPTSPPPPLQEKKLSVEEPEVPTPPVGAISLAQIGVKPSKGKACTAAQIESSLPDSPTPKTPSVPSTPETPVSPVPKTVPGPAKKNAEKKSSSAEVPGPVPPPRKKEKKPKEK